MNRKTILLCTLGFGCSEAVVGTDIMNPDPAQKVLVRAPAEVWLAYRADGEWKQLEAQSPEFTPGEGGKYTIAFQSTDGAITLFAATREELSEFMVGASADTPRYRLSGRVLNATPPAQIVLTTNRDRAIIDLPDSGAHPTDFEMDAGGKLDLTALEYSGNPAVELDKIRILRDLNIVQNQSRDVDFGTDFIVPVPQFTRVIGADYSGVTLLTAGGQADLGKPNLPRNGDLHWYSLGSGTLPEDVYLFTAEKEDARIERIVAAVSEPSVADFDLTRIAPLRAAVEASRPARLTNLDRPSTTLYTARIGAKLSLYVSGGYLGGEDSFEVVLPESLEGFDPRAKLAPSTETEFRITAISSNRSLSTLLYQSREPGFESEQVDSRGSFISAN